MKSIILVFSCFFLLLACGGKERENARKFAIEKRSLACKMEHLKLQSDSLWDEMETYLDETLPTDMPPPERKNMVTIRNANLIAMFKAFPKLDSAIQQKVNEASTTDRAIADSMKAVMDSMDGVEHAMNKALLQVQEQSEHKYLQLKRELHELENKPCHL